MAFTTGKTIIKWTTILSILDYIIFLITALFSIIIIANLQPKNYGFFALAATIYPLLSSILQSLIVYPIIRIASIYYEKRDLLSLGSLVSFSLVFISAASIFLFLSSFLIADFIAVLVFHAPNLAIYIEILSINIVSLSLIGLIRGILLSLKSFTKLAISRFLDGISYVVGIYLIAMLYGWSIYSVSLGTDLYLIASLAANLIILLIELRKIMVKLTFKNWRKQFSEIINLGKYFIISGNIYYFYLRLDLLLIPQFISDPILIGYYAFAKNILYRIRIFFTRINALLYPTFSGESIKFETKTIIKLLKAGILVSLTITLPISIYASIFSKEILIILSKMIPRMISYIDSWPLISIFSFIIIPYALNANINAYFNGIGEVDKQVYANAILITTYVALFPIITIIYGITGSAISYIASHYIRTFYWLIITDMRVRLNKKKYLFVSLANLLSAPPAYITYLLIKFILNLIKLNELLILITSLISSLFVIIIIEIVLLIKLHIIRKYEFKILRRLLGRNKLMNYILSKIEKSLAK